MTRKVAYRKEALRVLRRMPANEARRVMQKIDQLAAFPEQLAPQVKRLQGRPGFRLRVGDWRVIFDEAGDVLDILAIGPRGSVYEP
ncbi:type II toxin-antitoxin system RelE/ParE family toxin [Phreatobacter sp.]|uniref:type II toxin-antitoxin system RelE family toxin n=1 Tax=Phreatobacter sp. TaxID=1966341 RepID=UPI0034481CAC